MSTEREKVDVLAIIDAEIATLPVMAEMASLDGVTMDPSESIRRLEKARDVLVHLIDAARDFPEEPNPYTYRIARGRLADALSRIGPQS